MPSFKFTDSSAAKILVRGTNWLGDAVMTLPALKALKENFPQSAISILSKPAASAPYLLSGLAYEFLPILKDEQHRGLNGLWRLSRELKAKNFAAAVLFQNAFGAALTAFLAGIPQRLGYARDGRGLLLNPKIKLTEQDYYQHEIFYYLNILEKAGLNAPFSLPELKINEELKNKALTILKNNLSGEFKLALAPGAAYGSAKKWPIENFAEAASLILKEKKGCAFIFGSTAEAEDSQTLTKILAKKNISCQNLAGRYDLLTSLALLQQMNLLVANDSGLMHLGGALGVAVVAAFGPTNPLTTAPLWKNTKIVKDANVSCSPCLKRECPLPRRHCFDQVSPQLVAQSSLDLMAGKKEKGQNKAVFLDRDGTINVDVDFLSHHDQLELLPQVGPAIASLNQAGFKVIVVTNQSGLARGYFKETDLEAIHEKMRRLLAQDGAHIDAFYFCPHHPEGVVPELSITCQCRKPNPFMFEEAARKFNIDLSQSYWVGDRLRDLEPAKKFGGYSALVLTGYGLSEAKKNPLVDVVAPNLKRASEWILTRQ